jgi:hypothetical protein
MTTPINITPLAATPADLYRIQQRRNADGSVEILGMANASGEKLAGDETLLRSFPGELSEEAAPSSWIFEERILKSSKFNSAETAFLQKMPLQSEVWPGAEVRTIVSQGPASNRIDLTIVGDGYTAAEKARFFEDAQRLTSEMFVGKAFASYLALFNVHAVFIPSKESGITDTKNKDTALGLYRSPKGSKRAIMPGNAAAARRAIRLAPATDYSILLANDDFYGGLGGEFAITTRSPNSGSMVLNHELGHNISEVGEEYDGGDVYSGANFSSSKAVPWGEWVDGELKVENAEILAVSYPWKNLSSGAVAVPFTMPGKAGENALVVDLSSVGWSSPDDVEILIDGKVRTYEGIFTNDRSFFRLTNLNDVLPGRHELLIREKKKDGDNVLAAIRVMAHPKDYDFTPFKVGAFPLFASGGRFVGYRSTHESCLMRNMRHPNFCSVDQQNIWHNLLRRVSLIDGVKSLRTGELVSASVKTPDLPGLSIQWYLVGADGEKELPEFRDKKSWEKSGLAAGAEMLVRVRFETKEVRESTKDFEDAVKFRVD